MVVICHVAGTCRTDLLNALFNREDPAVFANSYLALLLARYTYPTAFGVSSTTEATQQTYEELYRRKWSALGALPGSIRFVDEKAPVPVLGLLMSQPEAHAVVLANKQDVFVSYRGLTNVESGLTENSKFTPVNGTFGEKVYLPVHGGFYSSFVSIWPQVKDAIQHAITLTAKPSDARVYLSGHSMGAALAVYAAMNLVSEHIPIGAIYLFGAPKMGQQQFVDAFQDFGLNILTFNWWNELDMIPAVSPPLGRNTLPYVQLPLESLYRIWDGECAKASGITAKSCPISEDGPGSRCRKNLNDHFAFTYIMKMQTCMMRQPAVAENECLQQLLNVSI